VELRDAERFRAGLDGLTALLEEQAGGEFTVRNRPYHDQPLWTFIFGGGGFSGPFAVSPSLAIVKNHLIVTITSTRAKREIKRLMEEPGELHPVLSFDPPPPQDASLIAYMDWPTFVNGAYKGARALLTFASGMSDGDMPFDPRLLPDAETFTRFFRPTVAWSHRVGTGARVTRIESSFGPETLLGAVVGVGSLAVGVQQRTRHVEVEQVQTEEDPERAAAIEATQATLSEVATRLEVYRIENDHYPRTLAVLLEPTPNFPRGYLEREDVPNDGWERELHYQASTDGSSYSLWSLGENGVDEGGAGDDVRVP